MRKEKLETAFDQLLDKVRPTQELLFAAHAMFKVLWTQRETEAQEQAQKATRELQGVERKIGQLVARLVETGDSALVGIYEAQLRKLHDEKNLMAEKAVSGAHPRRSFDETFRTCFAFLSNPRVLWDFGKIESRRKMLRLLFGGRIQYAVSEGLRTPQTTLLFKAFQQFANDNSGMAHPTRFERVASAFGGTTGSSVEITMEREEMRYHTVIEKQFGAGHGRDYPSLRHHFLPVVYVVLTRDWRTKTEDFHG